MQTPFFSILVPVYNQKEYLSDCINSIISQNFEDFELILVDDGSNDGSSELCDLFAGYYPQKILVIHQKNSGLLSARRTAINVANGQYILFLDSDDEYRSDTLKILYDTIATEKSDMVIYNLSTNEKYFPALRKYPFGDFKIFNSENKIDLYILLCSTYLLNNLVIKCVRHSLFDDKEYEGYCDVVNYGEDLFQSIPLLDRSEHIVFINQILYFYRQHPQSMTHKFTQMQFESLKIVYQRLETYACKWKNEYNIDFEELVRHHIGKECLNTAKNIISSSNSKEVKLELLGDLRKDEFYKKYQDTYRGKSFFEKILHRTINKGGRKTILIVGFLLNKYRFVKYKVQRT